MIVRCNWCLAILTEPGALLFTPPDNEGTCTKVHLCRECYERAVHPAPSDRSEVEREMERARAEEREAWAPVLHAADLVVEKLHKDSRDEGPVAKLAQALHEYEPDIAVRASASPARRETDGRRGC